MAHPLIHFLQHAPTQAVVLGASPHEPSLPSLQGAAAAHEPPPRRSDALGVERLHQQLSHVAAALRDQPEGAVVLACRARGALIAGLLGAWQAGRAVELPPDAEPHTMARLRSSPEISCILHDVPGEPGVYLPALCEAAGSARAELRVLGDDETLVWLHTSGSTSLPRRVPKSARTLLGEVEALHQTFTGVPARFLATVPAQHLYGLLFGVLLPLRRGSTIVDAPALFPLDVERALRAHDVGTLVSTPSHLRALLRAARPWPRALQVLTSAAPLPAELHHELLALGWNVHDVLGSTETGGVATRSTPGARWRPLAGVHVTEDPHDQSLRLRSAWSSVDRLEDRVRVHDDGHFEHLGRLGREVKVAGKRVDMDAMEQLLKALPGVLDAAVLALDDPMRGQRLAALIAPDTLDLSEVRRALGERFDPLLMPRPLVAMATLPREPNGKLPRDKALARLRPPTEPPTEGQSAAAKPATAARRAQLDDREGIEQAHTLTLLEPMHSPYFKGHFPNHALLPGAALLLRVREHAERRWPDLGRMTSATRLRFVQPLRPGHPAQLVMKRNGRRVVYDVFAEGGGPLASGRLHFDASTEPLPQGPKP